MSYHQKENSFEQVAKRACAYARTYILLGTTQLINNTYPLAKKRSLSKAVYDLRNACNENSLFLLEIDLAIKNFYQTIELCKKYSLGNCYELALMALDYVVHNASEVDAEVYQIKGGDHVFLVIGRPEKSHINKPETWGNEAYICDPWSNDVYPASQYLSKIKNYYRVGDDAQIYNNYTEDFNPSKHVLSPLGRYNTSHIRSAQSDEHLKKMIKFFEEKSAYLLNAMNTLEEKLTDIAIRLLENYGDDNEKIAVICKMIQQLHSSAEAIRANINKDHEETDYIKFRVSLEKRLSKNVDAYSQAIKLDNEDKKVLYKYNNEDSLSSRIMRFFNIPPTTVSKTNQALHDTAEEIKIILNDNMSTWKPN